MEACLSRTTVSYLLLVNDWLGLGLGLGLGFGLTNELCCVGVTEWYTVVSGFSV